MEQLGALYHWSPAERRDAILLHGLQPHSHPVVHTPERNGKALSYPYVCLAPVPSAAWGYSGGVDSEVMEEYGDWDLWQVRLGEHDRVQVLTQWGRTITEVRVRNAIPAHRLWLVATRGGVHEGIVRESQGHAA